MNLKIIIPILLLFKCIINRPQVVSVYINPRDDQTSGSTGTEDRSRLEPPWYIQAVVLVPLYVYMPRAIRVAAAATAAPLRIVVVARLARVHHASPLYPPYLCSPGVPIQYNAISVLLYIYIYIPYTISYIFRDYHWIKVSHLPDWINLIIRYFFRPL